MRHSNKLDINKFPRLVIRVGHRNVLCAVAKTYDPNFLWIRAIRDAGANNVPTYGDTQVRRAWQKGQWKRVHARWLAEHNEQS